MRDIKPPAPFTLYYSSLVEISKMEIEKKMAFPCRLVLFLLGFVFVISVLGHWRCRERGSSFCTVVRIAGRRARRLVFLFVWNKIWHAFFIAFVFLDRLGFWGIHHEPWCDLVVGHVAFVRAFNFRTKRDMFEYVDFSKINRILLS